MRFGRFEVHAIRAGTFALDGGAMFGSVPKVMWETEHAADASNRIELALRCLLVRSGTHVVLVDTGMGEDWPEVWRERYALRNRGAMDRALRAVGLERNDVTDVILSHLHFDHAGGATRAEGGTWVPVFPRATVHVQRRQWRWARHATEKDRASYVEHTLTPLEDCHRLHLLNGPEELLDGLRILVSEGHTVGQQLVQLDGGEDGKLVWASDLVPTASHIRPPYIMSYDLYPLTTLEEKKLLLAQALEEEWAVAFDHDPRIPACRLREQDGRVTVGELVPLEELGSSES